MTATLTLIGGIGAAMMAGIFFIFSVAIMPALDRLPPAHGMAAMQSINRVILNPLFLLLFTGTGVVCAVVAASVSWEPEHVALRIAGGLAYVLGSFAVTAARNVPWNNELDRLPAEEANAEHWRGYVRRWTAWNHVRTVACLASAVLLLLAV